MMLLNSVIECLFPGWRLGAVVEAPLRQILLLFDLHEDVELAETLLVDGYLHRILEDTAAVKLVDLHGALELISLV